MCWDRIVAGAVAAADDVGIANRVNGDVVAVFKLSDGGNADDCAVFRVHTGEDDCLREALWECRELYERT